MKSDFKAILREYGHEVHYQRHTIGPCGEIEYSDELEIHTTRYTIGLSSPLSKRRNEAAEGVLNDSERVYYFLPEVQPYENDRLYELSPRAKDDTEVWVIDTAAPMRGVGGQIIFWTVGATKIQDG